MGRIVFTVNVILDGAIIAVALSAGVLVLLEIGRRISVRQFAEEESASKGLGAIEGAISRLLGVDPRIFVFWDTRCLLLPGGGNGAGADAAPARAEGNVRNHHEANAGR